MDSPSVWRMPRGECTSSDFTRLEKLISAAVPPPRSHDPAVEQLACCIGMTGAVARSPRSSATAPTSGPVVLPEPRKLGAAAEGELPSRPRQGASRLGAARTMSFVRCACCQSFADTSPIVSPVVENSSDRGGKSRPEVAPFDPPPLGVRQVVDDPRDRQQLTVGLPLGLAFRQPLGSRNDLLALAVEEPQQQHRVQSELGCTGLGGSKLVRGDRPVARADGLVLSSPAAARDRNTASAQRSTCRENDPHRDRLRATPRPFPSLRRAHCRTRRPGRHRRPS